VIPIDDAALPGILGSDLLALIAERGVRLTRAFEVTRLRTPARNRGAFALDFADGLRLKARRLESCDEADRMVRLAALLGPGHARIVAWRGNSALFEWIEGPTLAALPALPADLVRQCGSLLGSLHRVDSALAGIPGSDTSEIAAKIERVAALVRHTQAGAADLLRRAVDAAERARPPAGSLGLVHQDFCAENLVLSRGRGPVSIDDAALTIAPHDLDLGRTWYRWSMTRDERRQLAAGYAKHRSLAAFLAHFEFWAVAALLGSMSSRLKSRLPLDVPLARLAALIASPSKSADDPDHPFWTASDVTGPGAAGPADGPIG
jgi:hypothetical protein